VKKPELISISNYTARPYRKREQCLILIRFKNFSEQLEVLVRFTTFNQKKTLKY